MQNIDGENTTMLAAASSTVPMNYGHGLAIMILVGETMGLAPRLVEAAQQCLQGVSIQPITGAAMEQEANSLNNQLRQDATLIAEANRHAEHLKKQYGFIASTRDNHSRPES